MFKIYPKTNEYLEGLDVLKKAAEDYGGIEIQFFHRDIIMDYIDFTIAAKKVKNEIPNLNEITIHPPLENYNIEHILLKDKNILYKELDDLINLSNELNVDINLVMHTNFNDVDLKEALTGELRIILDKLNNTRVTILLENLYFIEETKMSVLEYVSYINHPNLKVCFDLCHAYCKVHMYKSDNISFLDNYIDKEKCLKYVKQVHFSFTRNNDGYIVHNTHGRKHDYYDALKYDLALLERYGMIDKNLVIEVDEDSKDYNKRCDEVNDIKMLYSYIGKEY